MLRSFACSGHLSAILTALVIFSPTEAPAQGGPAAVGVETVEIQRIAETVPLFAEVVTAREGTVASRINGTVDNVLVLEGAVVEKGDLLVKLDTELLDILARQAEARLSEARAGITIAESSLARATNALARIEGLRDTASFSTSRFRPRVMRARLRPVPLFAPGSVRQSSLCRYSLGRARPTRR